MILFDVNVLVYAHREDQEWHAFYRARLEEAISGAQSFGLTPLVAGGFVRVVTGANFPNGPTPLPQALAVVDGLMELSNSHWVNPGKRHWELVSALCRATRRTGKGVADAQHAAIAIEHACTWISRDKDFLNFEKHGLRFEHWAP
jgi:toxin-antitoxin system PIN domain toxin